MPVLGYDTAGASSRGDINIARGTPSQTDGLGGVIRKWHCAIAQIGSPADIKLAVYDCDQSTGDPSSKSLVEQVEYVVAVSDDESTAALNIKPIEADTWYLLCVIMKNASTHIKYDNFGGAKNYHYKTGLVYADQFPDPADAGWVGGAASLYSIWVDYEHPGILGYDTPGGSSFGLASSYQGVSWPTDGAGGFVKNFHMAVAAIGSPNEVKMCIADCDQTVYNPSGKPVLEQTGAFVVEVSDDNVKAAKGDTKLDANTFYYISKAVSTGNIKVKYDSVPPGRFYKLGMLWGTTFLNPLPTAFSFQENIATFSIWIDYQRPGILGYDTVGVSNIGADTVIYGHSSKAGEISGHIQEWHVAVASINAPVGIKLCVSDTLGTNHSPASQDVIEQIEFDAEVSDDNSIVAVQRKVVLSDTHYYLGFIVENNGTKVKYDAGGNTAWAKGSRVYADEFISPHPADFSYLDNWLFSIWVDYTYGGVLGYDIAGAATMHGYNTIRGNNDIIGVRGGVIQNFHLAIGQASTGDFKVGVAKTSGGDPSEQDMVEQAETGSGYAIDDFLIAASRLCLLEADTTYYLCVVTNSVNDRMRYDSISGWDYYSLYISLPWGDMIPDPIPAAMQYLSGYAVSVWVDYQHSGILGYSIAGVGGSHGIIDQYRGSNDVTDDNGGEIKRFHMAVASVDAVNKNVKMAVADCAQGDGDPSNGAIIEQIEFQVEVSDDEWADAAGGNNVLADTKYFIAFAVPDADTKIKYDILPECWYDWGWVYGDVFPNPLDVAHVKGTNVLYSLWVDYEAAGGEEFIRSISDTIGITDNLLRSVGLVRKITGTIGISDVLAATRIRVRKIADTVGITDVLKFTVTIARKVDSFGVCQIVKIEKKLVSAVRRVNLSGISNVVQSMPYKNSKINEAKENMKPTISRVKGIKNE